MFITKSGKFSFLTTPTGNSTKLPNGFSPLCGKWSDSLLLIGGETLSGGSILVFNYSFDKLSEVQTSQRVCAVAAFNNRWVVSGEDHHLCLYALDLDGHLTKKNSQPTRCTISALSTDASVIVCTNAAASASVYTVVNEELVLQANDLRPNSLLHTTSDLIAFGVNGDILKMAVVGRYVNATAAIRAYAMRTSGAKTFISRFGSIHAVIECDKHLLELGRLMGRMKDFVGQSCDSLVSEQKKGTLPVEPFVDGDLIQHFSDLSEKVKGQIATVMQQSVESIEELVSSLNASIAEKRTRDQSVIPL